MNDQPTQKRSASYVIVGKPVPWARPGRTRYSTAAYDTQKREKQEYGWHFKISHANDPFFRGPLHIDFVFYMPVTNTDAKKRFERYGKPHMVKPDLDNLCKFILDAATGILYDDDAILSSFTAKKIYDENPRTILTITEL